MKKKPTSYIIWVLAVLPVILSVAFWTLLYATRQPRDYSDYEEYVPREYKDVDKAVIYMGSTDWNPYVYGYDSCTVEGSFHADTLVIISTDKSITVDQYD